MGKRVPIQFKLLAVTAVLCGKKQAEVCAALDIPSSSMCNYMKEETVLAKAKTIVEPALRLARKKAAGRLGGLARWGKYESKKTAPPEPKRKKRVLSPQARAAMSERQKARWAAMEPEERELRQLIMRDGRNKKAQTA